MQFSSESRAIFRQIPDGFCESYHGVLAQLGERKVRNLEVRGSIPLCSTNKKTIHGMTPWIVFYWSKTRSASLL